MASGNQILYVASTFGHLASFHQPYMAWFAENGYTVHAAAGGEARELAGVSRYIPLPFEKRMSAPGNFKAARQLRKLLQAENYRMLSLHTALAAFFARLPVMAMGEERPVVMNTAHGYLFDADTPWLKRMLLLGAERVAAPVTDWLLTMNRQDYDIAGRYRLGRRIVPTRGMGVDLARFARPSPQQKARVRRGLGLPPDAVVLVYAGEFSGRKHQAMLIEAMAGLPGLILLLPGRGALLEECRELARRVGVGERVRFPGFVQDVETYYAAADVCVSSSRSEGLPFNVMEAMACGLPAVLSDVKGHQDLVRQGENGLLYPFGEAAAFREAVRQLADPAVRRRMGERAWRGVQQYGLASVLPELTALYARAAGMAPEEGTSKQ